MKKTNKLTKSLSSQTIKTAKKGKGIIEPKPKQELKKLLLLKNEYIDGNLKLKGLIVELPLEIAKAKLAKTNGVFQEV